MHESTQPAVVVTTSLKVPLSLPAEYVIQFVVLSPGIDQLLLGELTDQLNVTPALAVAQRVLPVELQLGNVDGAVKEQLGFGFTVACPDPDPVQPFSSVTVTE